MSTVAQLHHDQPTLLHYLTELFEQRQSDYDKPEYAAIHDVQVQLHVALSVRGAFASSFPVVSSRFLSCRLVSPRVVSCRLLSSRFASCPATAAVTTACAASGVAEPVGHTEREPHLVPAAIALVRPRRSAACVCDAQAAAVQGDGVPAEATGQLQVTWRRSSVSCRDPGECNGCRVDAAAVGACVRVSRAALSLLVDKLSSIAEAVAFVEEVCV